MTGFYDISPLVSERYATFPMDVPYSRDVSLHFNRGDHLTLSSITTTLHVGAHADAPIHYHKEGMSIDQRDLNLYLGPCQVIDVSVDAGARILMKDIENKKIEAPRVLFKTLSFPDHENWTNDYASLSPELIQYVADQKVVLVGIDTPSVDPHDSKHLESHNAIFENDLAILEGLDLKKVPEGLYTLVALPLKLENADASPVRAVLVKGNLG